MWCALNPVPTRADTTEDVYMMRPCDPCRQALRVIIPAPTTPELMVRALRHEILDVYFTLSVLQGEYQAIGIRYAFVVWPTRIDERLPSDVRRPPFRLFTRPEPQDRCEFFIPWRMAEWLAGRAYERLHAGDRGAEDRGAASTLLSNATGCLTVARNSLEQLGELVRRHENLERQALPTPAQGQLRWTALRDWVRTLPETPRALASGQTLDEVARRVATWTPDGPVQEDNGSTTEEDD